MRITSNNVIIFVILISIYFFLSGNSILLNYSPNTNYNNTIRGSGPRDRLNAIIMTSMSEDNIRVNDTIAYAAGDSGTVIKTTNNGVNWCWVPTGTTLDLNSIYFPTLSTGWIVGDSGRILKTTNGGVSWMNQTATTLKPLNSICFRTVTNGLVVGDSGKIFRTTNGGINWIHSVSNTSAQLNSVYTATSRSWVAGDSGKILRSDQGDTTWSLQSSGTTIRLMSIHFPTNSKGWAVGDSGKILKTTNNGSNWITQSSGTSRTLKSVFFISATTGWVSGDSGLILRTTNGSTWTSSTISTKNLNSVCFSPSQKGWTVGSDSAIYRTTDGGYYWTQQYIDTCSISGIRILNNSIPLVCKLHQNYPNPFNPTTKIRFDLRNVRTTHQPVFTRLVIYDALAREVAILVEEQLKPGSYEVVWEGRNFPSGIYFCKLIYGEYSETKRMVLLK